jgi:putative molybdopterin biosynthesis protein
MSEFLTTRELAALLRVKERKVYDLVAQGKLPVRRVTGKLLFPRIEIEAWLGSGRSENHTAAPLLEDKHAPRPLIVAGGHDPLLEWALRESGSGLASFLDGALDGIKRAAAGECLAAGLHIPGDDDDWNVATVVDRFGEAPWVLIEWARRSRGLIIGRNVERQPKTLKETRGLCFQARQPEAGSELVLARLLAREDMTRDDLHVVPGVQRSETDLAIAIADGRADVGLGIATVARQFNLDFVPLIEERFDLLVWRKAYFDAPFQKLVTFCRSEAFAARAHAFGGYALGGFGTVHFNGP